MFIFRENRFTMAQQNADRERERRGGRSPQRKNMYISLESPEAAANRWHNSRSQNYYILVFIHIDVEHERDTIKFSVEQLSPLKV